MKAKILKALRSLYKINGMFYEGYVGTAQYRINLQEKCGADFYCVFDESLYLYSSGDIYHGDIEIIINHLNNQTNIRFTLISDYMIEIREI